MSQTGEKRASFGRMGPHAFRPYEHGGTDACHYCGVRRDKHDTPSDAVVAGGAALRAMWPGWLKDGGGIAAVQDSQRAAAAVLEAAERASGGPTDG